VSLGFTSTFSKRTKKTKKPVNWDQSFTLQRLIKKLITSTDSKDKESLQSKPTSESNNDSNIFLNLYNKIVAHSKDQLKKDNTRYSSSLL